MISFFAYLLRSKLHLETEKWITSLNSFITNQNQKSNRLSNQGKMW